MAAGRFTLFNTTMECVKWRKAAYGCPLVPETNGLHCPSLRPRTQRNCNALMEIDGACP